MGIRDRGSVACDTCEHVQPRTAVYCGRCGARLDTPLATTPASPRKRSNAVVGLIGIAAVAVAVAAVTRPGDIDRVPVLGPTATESAAPLPRTPDELALADAPRCVVVEIERRCVDAALALPDDRSFPFIRDGRIFVSGPVSTDAYDAATFEPLWSVPSDGREFVTGAVGDILLVSSPTGDAVALDQFDGRVRWERPVPGGPDAFDPVMGRLAGTFVLPPGGPNDTDMIVEVTPGRMARLDLDGEVMWDVPVTDSEESAIIARSADVLFVRDGDFVVAIDLADGSMIRELAIPPDTYVEPAEGVLLAFQQDPETFETRSVTAVDAFTGAELWTAPTGGSAASPADGLVGVEDQDVLSVRDVVTGEVVWSVEGRSVGLLPPDNPDEPHLVVTSDDGSRRFDIRDQRDGRHLWSVLPDSPEAYPTAQGAWVIVVSPDEFAYHARDTGNLAFRVVGLDRFSVTTAYDTDPMLVMTGGALYRLTPPDIARTTAPRQP